MMRFNNPILLNAADATITQLSEVLDGRQLYRGSVQVVMSPNTSSGSLVLQGSNDPIELLPGGEDPQNWATIETIVVSSGAFPLEEFDLAYRWLRVKWIPGSATGTITVTGMFIGF